MHARNHLHMLPNSEAEILKHFKTSVGRNGQFTTDSRVCKQTSDGDPRTGTFHQTPLTVGDTTCKCERGIRKGVTGPLAL